MVYSGRLLPDTSYSALLGLTVGTCYCQSRGFWVYCFRKQRNAWSSVVHAMRQSLSLLAGYDAPRAVFLPVVVRSQMLVIMAGMDQKERFLEPFRKTVDFPQFINVVDISNVLQRLIPMVLRTIEIPQLRLDTVVDAPFMQVVQVIPVVAQMQIPMVQAVLRTMDFLQLLDTVIDVPVVQVVLTVTCTVFGVRLRSTRCGFSGRGLLELFMYSALSGSTVVACSAAVLAFLDE